MSAETWTCGRYRLTIEYAPDAPSQSKISVFAQLPRDNGSQATDKVFHEMSIPQFVEYLVAGIRADEKTHPLAAGP